jgi:hypothetical protein
VLPATPTLPPSLAVGSDQGQGDFHLLGWPSRPMIVAKARRSRATLCAVKVNLSDRLRFVGNPEDIYWLLKPFAERSRSERSRSERRRSERRLASALRQAQVTARHGHPYPLTLKRAFGHRATEHTEKNQCVGKRTFITFYCETTLGFASHPGSSERWLGGVEL